MGILDLFIKVLVDDQASEKLESITSGAVAKGNIIANLFSSAVGAIGQAINAVYSFGQSIIGAYAQYEQNVGGIETLFKNAADTVISNSERAFETAGVSMNEYMQQATSLASSLVQSVAGSMKQTSEASTEAAEKALDGQLKAQQRAFSHAAREFQRQLSDQMEAQTKAYQKEYQAYAESLAKEVAQLQSANAQKLRELEKSNDAALKGAEKTNARILKEAQKANAQEVSDFEDATEQRLKIMEEEYERKVKLIDAETKKRIAAIDEQISALEGQGDADDAAEREAERAATIAELTKRTESEKTAKKRAEAREELAEYLAKIEKEDRDRARKEQIEALKEQRQDIRDDAAQRKSDLKDQYSEEVQAYRDSRKDMLASLKESQQEQIEQMREAQKEQVEQMRETQQQQVEQLRSSQAQEVAVMQAANQEKLEQFREAQQESLKEMQRSMEDQTTAYSEAQQDQLDALRESIAQQKKELREAATSNTEYVEATAEDYQRAAELADMAITDMSDNANKMGTTLGSIQFAYQGFAKSNFTMLDNLKLGYGGTKTEMERLLEDAENILAKNGEVRDFSIDSMADIVEAIHAVQTEYEVSGYTMDELRDKVENGTLTYQDMARVAQQLGYDTDDMGAAVEKVAQGFKDGSLKIEDAMILAGTTAREADSTIEGSFRSMGAAWENWLIALANPDADLEGATNDLIERVGVVADNLIPRIAIVLENLKTVIQERAPEILQSLKDEFMNALPPEWREKVEEVEQRLGEFFSAIGSGADFINSVKGAFDRVNEALGFLGTALGPVMDIITAFSQLFGGLSEAMAYVYDNGIKQGLMPSLDHLGRSVGNASDAFSQWAEPIGHVAGIIGNILVVALGILAEAIAIIIDIIAEIAKGLKWFGDMLDEAAKAVDNFARDAGKFFEDLGKGAEQVLKDIIKWFENLPHNIEVALGDLSKLLFGAGQDILNGLWDGLVDVWNGLTGWVTGIGGWIQANKGPKQYDLGLLVNNGKWIMQGFEKGLRDEFPSIEKAVGDVTDLMHVDGGMSVSSSADAWGRNAGGVVVHVAELVVREEADINRVADGLYRKIRREQEAYGWSTSYTMA